MIYDIQGNELAAAAGRMYHTENGRLNAVKVSRQQTAVEWTTTAAGMPNASDSSTIADGTTVTGLPYSSASVEDGYIGISVSLYTFMSAVHNPRSVLYTQRSKGYTGYAYYGTVCTSFACAAWGLPMLITTVALRKCDFVKQVQYSDIEIGDMLLSEGHAILVVGVERNSSGTVTRVKTAESNYPHCVENAWQTYAAFVSQYSGEYTAYRFTGIEDVSSYQPSPFLSMMGEEPEDVTFPDVMTCFGDKVTRKKGTDVVINVLDSTGYDSIKVYRDGALLSSHAVEDFTISAPETGTYEVRMTGSGKQSSAWFDIVDCAASISGNVLSFKTTYGAYAIGGYPKYTKNSSGKATSWNNPKRVRFLTMDERKTGSASIADMKADADCDGGIRVYCLGAYGFVSFEIPYE